MFRYKGKRTAYWWKNGTGFSREKRRGGILDRGEGKGTKGT